jgi:sulfide:quinone oxidoreductase
MAGHRVLVLGGGFGGIACAVALREQLSRDDEVVLVERRTTFVMGLRKNWAVLNAGAVATGERPLSRLAERGIRVIHGIIEAIEPDARAAVVDGERLEADALVVALGAARAPEAVPGFAEHAIDWYDMAQLERGRAAVAGLPPGGRVLVGIFGVPYPCPPAAFELALLINERLRARSHDGSVEVFSPQALSLPILGQAGCGSFESRLEVAGVPFHRSHVAARVEPGRVVFGPAAEGATAPPDRPFDVLFGIPPHRVPKVVADSGLTQGKPWVRVDPRTLETGRPGVFAIGDVTAIPLANGQMLPKAGLFAQRQGEVVAARLAATFRGEVPTATFDGSGACFLEVGDGMASMVSGEFLADPPQVRLEEPSAAHLEAKHAFERERLAAWFGA